MQKYPSLPSQNSAFFPPIRRNIEPNPRLCKQMVFSDASTKEERKLPTGITETINDDREEFLKRWKCACDVTTKNSGYSIIRVERVKKENAPSFDWIPIPAGPAEPSNRGILSRFQSTELKIQQRPESPVPFLDRSAKVRLSSPGTVNRYSPLILDNGKVTLLNNCNWALFKTTNLPPNTFSTFAADDSVFAERNALTADQTRSCHTPSLLEQKFKRNYSSKHALDRQLRLTEIFQVKKPRSRQSFELNTDDGFDVNELKVKRQRLRKCWSR